MNRFGSSLLGILLSLLLTAAAFAKGPAYTDPDKADADFAFQGEYVGTVPGDNGDMKVGVQVVAIGNGKFKAVAYPGGLPGDGWSKDQEKQAADGERQGDSVVFKK